MADLPPIPAHRLHRIFDERQRAEIEEALRGDQPYQPGILELIADYFDSPFGSGLIFGFVIGAFFTLGSAILIVWLS